MVDERIAAIRCQELDQLPALLLREARADADVLQRARIVEQAQQQRSDRGALALLVPAKARDDAIAIALVLDLEHHPLVGFVDARQRLRHHAVETRAFEAAEPVRRDASIACRRREMAAAAPTPASIDSSSLRRRSQRFAAASPDRPRTARSKKTIDAGISCDSIFTRDAAG